MHKKIPTQRSREQNTGKKRGRKKSKKKKEAERKRKDMIYTAMDKKDMFLILAGKGNLRRVRDKSKHMKIEVIKLKEEDNKIENAVAGFTIECAIVRKENRKVDLIIKREHDYIVTSVTGIFENYFEIETGDEYNLILKEEEYNRLLWECENK